MITYITDLEHRPSGGGSYAVNWHTCEQLRRHFNLHAPAPIVPQVPWWETLASRARRRLLKRPGHFAYFSERTLARNAQRVRAQITPDSQAVFFRSATRWCQTETSIPYFVYLDVVFHTFYHNTFGPEEFNAADLKRIWAAEARFLENANAVFFESQWGLERALEAYPLKGDHYEALGRGGVLEPPVEDRWDGESRHLVTIAMNFEQKGGDILLAAFDRLRQRIPGLRWSIIGGEPSSDQWREFPEIEYVGQLRPDHDTELAQFRDILANAFLLIHPTREDTNPLVLTEAAYFGCPAVSVRQFGIPELVIHGETGLLLEPPVRPEDLADAVEMLAANPDVYRQMRRRARAFALEHGTWDKLGQRLAERIRETLSR